MRNLKLYIMLFAILSIANLTQAQKAEAPDFKYDLEGSVEKMTLTSSGVLLITHGKGLAGIKPGQEGLVFNFDDYGKVKEEEIHVVPNTPYVMVGQAGFAGISAKQSVIDILSGKRLFDTKANGWKAVGRPTLLMPENKLIVTGQRTSKEKFANAVGVYDMGTGKEESLFTLKGYDNATGEPKIINGSLIIPTMKGIINIDMNSGTESWTADIKNVDFVVSANDDKSFYAFINKGKNHEIVKLDNNGKEIWADGVKLKGKVSNFEITPKGLAIVSDVADSGKRGLAKLASAKAQSNISFLSANNGEDLWENAPKTKGYVQHFYIMGDGILFGIAEGGINKVSFEGQPLFRKPLKTGENIHTMALTDQGMIYITDEDADIINLETGESIWSKPIKYKRAKAVASNYDEAHKRYLISTGEEMIAIDEITGDVSTIAKYEFDEKEDPTDLQIRDGGLLLTSDQNMMMLDFDGKEKYHEYFRSPGKSAFAVVALGAMALASTAMAADASFKAGYAEGSLGPYHSTTSHYQRSADMFSSIGTASFNEMAKRFSATAATENVQFILTKLDDGVGLVKVNKDSGVVEKEIILKDKKPTYEVDDFGGMLYYLAGKNGIYAYDLKK